MTLALGGQPEAIGKILAAMPAGDTNQPLQLHYAYVLRTHDATGWTTEQKAQLDRLVRRRPRPWRGGASFPGFLNLLFDESLRSFDAAEKKLAYEKVPQFAPLTRGGARRGRPTRGAVRGPTAGRSRRPTRAPAACSPSAATRCSTS